MSGLRPSPWADRTAPGSLSKRPHTRAQTKHKPQFVPEHEMAWNQKPIRQWNPQDVSWWFNSQQDLGAELKEAMAHLDGAGIIELAHTKGASFYGVDASELKTVLSRVLDMVRPPAPSGTIFDEMGRSCGGSSKKRKMGSIASPTNTSSRPLEASIRPIEDTPEVLTESLLKAHTLAPRTKAPEAELNQDAKSMADIKLDECTNKLMMEQENFNMPSADYLDQHPTLDAGMRAVLVDWMMEVCREFEMQRESFYLAISVLDHFLSCVREVHQSKLQLVGVASMLIAAKMEEIYPPKVHELALITDGAFSTGELRKMEKCILEKLDWDVYFISPFRFSISYLKRISHTGERSKKQSLCEIMALLDLSLLDYQSCSFLPSQLAAAALHIVLQPSPSILSDLTGRTAPELKKCVEWMSRFRWLVTHLLASSGSPGWCCPASSLYRNVVHPQDVHLVQPYYPEAIQRLKEQQEQQQELQEQQ